MKVRVYPEGDSDAAEDYNDPPEVAAQRFAEEWEKDGNLCVEALDDEARALPGWKSDEDSPHFKMFKARVEHRYQVSEVENFRS